MSIGIAIRCISSRHFDPPPTLLWWIVPRGTRERRTAKVRLSRVFFVVESALSPEFHKQDIHVGGRNPGDTRSLADRCRADAREFLPCLDRERLHRMIVEIGRDGDIFEPMQLFGDEFFPLDISVVLDLDLRFFDRFGRHSLFLDQLRELGEDAGQAGEGDFVAKQDVVELPPLLHRFGID